jgi:hypothetical protein
MTRAFPPNGFGTQFTQWAFVPALLICRTEAVPVLKTATPTKAEPAVMLSSSASLSFAGPFASGRAWETGLSAIAFVDIMATAAIASTIERFMVFI